MPLRLKIISNHPDLGEEARRREFVGVGGTIGRSAENDWVLPDDRRYVSSRHAVVDYQAGAYYLIDTSRNGVYVNGADTPVGQGHPQRLFDGDRLRIGEYEIAVDISDADDEIPEDGMRDSIVRAQLVPEEESVELMLVSEDKLLRDATLQRHLTPAAAAGGASVRPGRVAAARPAPRAQPPAPRKPAAAPAPRGAPATPPVDHTGDDPADALARALELFLAGAGVKPDSIAGHTPAEVLQASGKLLRCLVGGLMELLRDRSHMKDTLRLPQTVMQAANNNPLKFSPSLDEALRYLLNDRSDAAYLAAEDAVRAGFRDLRQHEQALVKAMNQALQDYVDRFDPEELKVQFDKGLKRSGLLSGANKLKYWELYEESYPALTQREDGGPPQLFSEGFARAYVQELDSSRGGRNR